MLTWPTAPPLAAGGCALPLLPPAVPFACAVYRPASCCMLLFSAPWPPVGSGGIPGKVAAGWDWRVCGCGAPMTGVV